MSTRYRKSAIIEAKYWIQDNKSGSVLEYATNSVGKRIANMKVKSKTGEIGFSSFQEVLEFRKLLDKGIEATRGKWIVSKDKK